MGARTRQRGGPKPARPVTVALDQPAAQWLSAGSMLTVLRPSCDEKRERMRDRYAARAATQAELEAERRAGHWATARDED